MKRIDFDTWMMKVNKILEQEYGLSSEDLPDCCYADWHDDGVSPRSAANRAIAASEE